MNTDRTGFHTCKECHKTESLWNHTTTDHKEGEQLEDRRSVGASSCKSGDGADQRVQSLMIMMMIVLTAIMLTPGGSSTVHIYSYTQTIHRTTQITNWEECGPCPVFESYTLVFALQLRKKHGKTCQGSRRVPVGTMKTEYTEQSIQYDNT